MLSFHHTRDPSWIFGTRAPSCFAPFACIAWLHLIFTRTCSWICYSMASTGSASNHQQSHPTVRSFKNVILGCIRWTPKKGVHFVVSDAGLFAVHTAIGSHFTQSSCWWLTNTRRYCSILKFICPVWPSVCRWKALDILHWIPKRLHNWHLNVEANWSPWSEGIIAGCRWRCTTSFQNNSADPRESLIE